MEFQACGGLEGSLFEDDASARISRLKRQRDQRFLIVGIRFFIDEREHEAAWWLDNTERAADVEDISLCGLHQKPVIPSLDRIKLKARNGESGRPPPAPKLLGVDERSRDALREHGQIFSR